MQTINDLDRITEALDLTGAIETCIWDELTDGSYWNSVEDIVRQLETASCANGSWNSMIYTADINDRLADSQWVADIDQALEDFSDATGETVDFSTLSEVVTFAVDWVAQNLASRLRYLNQIAVVVSACDSMDPNPDVIAFPTVSDAEDWVSEEVERRVQHQVDHSPYPVTDDELDQMREIELCLMTLTVENL